MNLGSALSGALGGLITGGPIGAAIGGIGGLLGGGGAGSGGLGGAAAAQQQQQMLSQMQQQNMQNLMFQQAINAQSQRFATLSSAQKAMHDSIMSMLNNAK
jgi:hypothetical protein